MFKFILGMILDVTDFIIIIILKTFFPIKIESKKKVNLE
jgi:hypothetical protein